jgi:hypothetical protein
MSDETSPEQLERVHRLAEAINQKKRVESDDARSTEDCLRADEDVQQALDDVRANKSEVEKSDHNEMPAAS